MFQYKPTSLDHYIVENDTCARSELNAGDLARKEFHHPPKKANPLNKIIVRQGIYQ